MVDGKCVNTSGAISERMAGLHFSPGDTLESWDLEVECGANFLIRNGQFQPPIRPAPAAATWQGQPPASANERAVILKSVGELVGSRDIFFRTTSRACLPAQSPIAD